VTIPAGITPAASFELAGFEPQLPPPVILADKIDPQTGEFASLVDGRTVAEGLVQHLLTVQRRTGASVRGFGHRLREIRHVDEHAAELVESYVREALQPGVDSGTIRLNRVEAEEDAEDPTQVNATIEYLDLSAPVRDQDRSFTYSP